MNAPPAMRAGPVIPFILTSRYHADPDQATMQAPSCQPHAAMATETLALGSGFEDGDALHVVGHREDVEGTQRSHGVAGRREGPDVPTEGCGIARHVRDAPRLPAYHLLDDGLADAISRRVAHDEIHATWPM